MLKIYKQMNDYRTFPDESRVWVYQSSRVLDEDEVNYVKVKLDDFVETWESHGAILKGSFDVLYNLFVVFFVDEDGDRACGRAIDSSIQMIKSLETELEVDFLDRMNLSYKKGEEVAVVKMNDFVAKVEEGEINEDTIVFNNMITTMKEFHKNWEVPVKESWHQQLLVTS